MSFQSKRGGSRAAAEDFFPWVLAADVFCVTLLPPSPFFSGEGVSLFFHRRPFSPIWPSRFWKGAERAASMEKRGKGSEMSRDRQFISRPITNPSIFMLCILEQVENERTNETNSETSFAPRTQGKEKETFAFCGWLAEKCSLKYPMETALTEEFDFCPAELWRRRGGEGTSRSNKHPLSSSFPLLGSWNRPLDEPRRHRPRGHPRNGDTFLPPSGWAFSLSLSPDDDEPPSVHPPAFLIIDFQRRMGSERAEAGTWIKREEKWASPANYIRKRGKGGKGGDKLLARSADFSVLSLAGWLGPSPLSHGCHPDHYSLPLPPSPPPFLLRAGGERETVVVVVVCATSTTTFSWGLSYAVSCFPTTQLNPFFYFPSSFCV